MKKFIVFLLLFLAKTAYIEAQIKISGIVIDKEFGDPISGVSVVEEGSTNGTMTDLNGSFSVNVAGEKSKLAVSFIGYRSVSIPVGNTRSFTIKLEENNIAIDEVVVTALNVPKQKKVLGYAIQDIKGEELTTSREANPITSLAGKIAGMRVTIPSDLLKSPSVTIRGVSPIYVVDGVPVASDTWNISPDDIETITVLKGPSAAVLYGSAGKNGAIQITTKRGTSNGKKFSVDVNSTNQFQTSFIAIPDVQNSYGPGYNYQYSFGDGLKGNVNGINNQDADVWGPRFEGQLIKQWDGPMDANGIRTPTPWLSVGKDNLKNYMQTGVITTNNVAIAQKSEVGDFRISLSETYQKGLFPNTSLNSFNSNFSGSMKLGNNVTLYGAINYNSTSSDNYPDVEYNPRSPLYLLTVWNGAQVDVRNMKNYWVPGMEGIQQYNYDYKQYNNPWFLAYENTRGHYKDDLHGQVNLTWRITADLDVRFRTNLSTYTLMKNEKYPVSGSVYDSAYKWVGGYEETHDRYTDSNSDFLLNYTKRLSGSFGLKATLGGAFRSEKENHSWAGTLGGLIVPGIYTLENSVESRPGRSSSWKKEMLSAYGTVDLDYKDYLFLSFSGRADKSSTLPIEHNSYFYPSVSLSGVVTDMVDLSKLFSFWRIRTSYANVGGDIEPYALKNTYEQMSIWNGQTPLTMGTTLFDPSIKPEFSSTLEVGTDIRFLKNRIGVDFCYFFAEDGPQIFTLTTAPSSGYSYRKVNGLTYTRRGFEASINGTVIKNKEFEWELIANLSQSRQYLKSVHGDLENLGKVKIGERADQIWGQDFMRSADGQIVYKDGLPVRDNIDKFMGYYNPDLFFGLTSKMKYKDFSLILSFDGSLGGKIKNDTWENLWRSGRHALSDNEHRLADWEAFKKDPEGFGNSYKGVYVGEGVEVTGGELLRNPNGDIISDTRTYQNNATPVLYQNWANRYHRTASTYIQDRSFLKLRELTFAYSVPKSWLKEQAPMIESASIAFVGRNLLYFTKANYIDLDQFTGLGTVLQTPSTRNFGFNINV